MDASLQLVLGLAAIFIAVVLILVALGVVGTARSGVGRSLAAVEAINNAPQSMVREELDKSFGDRVLAPFFQRLTQGGAKLTPSGQRGGIRRRLDLAGSPEGWDVERILAFKMLGLISGALIAIALSLIFGWSLLVALGVIAIVAVLGLYAPDIMLYQMAYERTERMRRELPDALDLLTISVEAGMSFDGALAQVAKNSEGPLAAEFFRVLQEMQIGVGRTEAIRAMGERTDLPDLRQFATAMVQADAFGIPIANVLRIQAKEMRIKRSQRAEEAAQKVPVKILFPLIFCILPSLFVVILGPAAINILQNLFGIG
jgi:tight adherence protein C